MHIRISDSSAVVVVPPVETLGYRTGCVEFSATQFGPTDGVQNQEAGPAFIVTAPDQRR